MHNHKIKNVPNALICKMKCVAINKNKILPLCQVQICNIKNSKQLLPTKHWWFDKQKVM